jgi:hypothetical protein
MPPFRLISKPAKPKTPAYMLEPGGKRKKRRYQNCARSYVRRYARHVETIKAEIQRAIDRNDLHNIDLRFMLKEIREYCYFEIEELPLESLAEAEGTYEDD